MLEHSNFDPERYWWRLISSFVFVILYRFQPATSHRHSQNTTTFISGFHSIHQQYVHCAHLNLFWSILLQAKGIIIDWHTNTSSFTFTKIWEGLGKPSAGGAPSLAIVNFAVDLAAFVACALRHLSAHGLYLSAMIGTCSAFFLLLTLVLFGDLRINLHIVRWPLLQHGLH